MPLLDRSDFEAPWYLRNPHLMMFWSSRRRVKKPPWMRLTFDLADGDFIHLDVLKRGNDRLAVIAPGITGNTGSKFVRGMARCLAEEGWDVVAWNFRGCSGVPNRLPRSYHGADRRDLDEIIGKVADGYETVVLVGFSLGANLALKYLGEKEWKSRGRIKAAIAISPPCDLAETVDVWNDGYINRLIQRGALKTMRKLAKKKSDAGYLDREVVADLHKAQTLAQADHFVLAPLNDFRNGADYWTEASSRGVLRNITIPTLIITARDDPLLAPTAYPIEEAEYSEYVCFETPRYGSHVGFVPKGNKSRYWPETRTLEFLDEHVLAN